MLLLSELIKNKRTLFRAENQSFKDEKLNFEQSWFRADWNLILSDTAQVIAAEREAEKKLNLFGFYQKSS